MSATDRARPNPAQHQAANALALDAVKLGHQLRIERHTCIIEKRKPAYLFGLLVHDAHHVWALLWTIVRDIERREDVGLPLQPFPTDQRGGRQ